jgi:hypothetical protein
MAKRADSTAPGSTKPSPHLWLLLGLLGGALLVLFFRSLEPHQILFNNDAPLGFLNAKCNQLPGRFAGTWRDLGWLGGEAAAASPDITMLLTTLISPVAFLKMDVPFSLLFLGFSAWLFFRQLNFHPMVCVLGGVAAGLNGHFFSNACWGLGHWNIAAGCSFLAMAALYAKSIPKIWERAVLAGLAVGMGLMEGYDVGAILSVYIGCFIVFRAFNDDAPVIRKVANAVVAETLVVLFAAIIAAHTMLNLVEVQVEGVASMGQEVETKAQRWNPATQWSLPKLETLQVFVPGLFGYRLGGNIPQKDHSSAYWGQVGQDPRIVNLGSEDPIVRSNVVVSSLKLPDTYLNALDTPDRHSRTEGMLVVTKKSGIYWRYSGSGECAGTIVSLLAVFGMANFFRKDRPYSKSERIAVGYWGVAALFSLLAAWGRFGFVYQFLYRLPYFSTIRNPIKFMHPFHIAWVILAAYGMEVLYRRYLRGPNTSTGFLPHHLQQWWAKVTGFDRHWTIFMLILAGASVAGTALLYLNKNALIHYLQDQAIDPSLAAGNSQTLGIINFCIQRAGAFVIVLATGMVALAAILSGAWSGSRIKWAWGCLAVLMIGDLARADIPWIRYYDYAEKYALNSVTGFLLDKPWEHRVIGKLEPRGPGSGLTRGFGQLYFFWLQNDFPYHNIQTLDYAQWPHIPDLDRHYLEAFQLTGTDIQTADVRPALRLWQLTNTRYILGSASMMDFLNQRIHNGFNVQGYFNIVPKSGIEAVGDYGDYTAESSEKGNFSIIEYPRALPRAKLYSNWRTPTNDAATLNLLTNQNFEPWDTVLIATNTPVPQPESTSTADAGTVTITDYQPKYVRLEADAKTSAVLLLNDRTGLDWHIRIDGASAPALRCNYIMRGVYLTPGHHLVEFRFRPSLKTFYLSVSAVVIGIILAGYLIITRKPAATSAAPTAPADPVTPPPVPVRPPAVSGKKRNGNRKAKGV